MLSIDFPRLSDTLISLFISFVVLKLVLFALNQRRSSRLPRLKGPSSNSFFFGRIREVLLSKDRAALYEHWAEDHGVVYQIPAPLGGRRVILCDPKAIVHLHSKDSFTYQALPLSKVFMKKFVSRYESDCGVNFNEP